MPGRERGSEIVQIDDPIRRLAGRALDIRQQTLRGGLGGGERLFDLVHGRVIVGGDRFHAPLAGTDELDELPRRICG